MVTVILDNLPYPFLLQKPNHINPGFTYNLQKA